MKTEITNQLNKLTTIIFLLVAGLIPLFLGTFTTDFYETPKLIFLLVAVTLLLILKTVSWVLSGKVVLTRTPIDVPLLLFIAVVLISAFVSPLRYISFLGSLPKVHGSASTWVLYVLFYFLATSHLKTVGQVKGLLQALLASGVVLSILSVLSYFGVYLPIQNFKFANFSPAGSTFSGNAILVILLPVLFAGINGAKKIVPTNAAIAISTLFALTLGLTGNLAAVVAAVIGFVLVFVFDKKKGEKFSFDVKSLGLYLPMAVFLLVLILGRVSLPGNVLYTKAQNYPRELEQPLPSSWKISASSFRDAPFFGTGPSTYLYDFTSYKPLEYNASNLWNIRFDSSFDELLQLFATVGALGLVAFLVICGVIITFAIKAIKNHGDDSLIKGVSVGAISAVVLLVLHPSTLVLIVGLFLIVAVLMALNKSEFDKIEEFTIGIKAWNPTKSDLIVGDALPLILLALVVIISAFAYLKAVPMILADHHHRLALNAAATQGLTTYNELVAAEQLNPNADLYRTDLAQTNFALANAIAQAKGPTAASPAGSLTAADKQNIQTLLSQSINEGRAAVTLNPRSAQNWEILASVYRQISGVAQNALQFSLDSYGRAIQLDPLNPLLRLSVGGVYYSVKSYDLAIRFFTDAINLKPDYANAYFNLAVAARDKGDLQTAVAAAQTLVTLVDRNSADYKTASDFLASLNAQASGSAQPTAAAPETASPSAAITPANADTSALQQKELPKVLNLPEPSSIATPSAVKK